VDTLIDTARTLAALARMAVWMLPSYLRYGPDLRKPT